MKRGQVYFNHYHDATGREKRIPVLILSRDDYNHDSDFVTAVRLAKYNNNPCAQHVFIPGSMLTDTTTNIGDCYALAEAVSSIRKSSLEGPIAEAGKAMLDMVCSAVEYQIGRDTVNTYGVRYSAADSPQMRETKPMREQEG